MVIHNIESFIKVYLFELLPYLLDFYEEFMGKESFVFFFRCEYLNILKVLERLRIVFRVKVINVIDPSHFFTTDIADTSFTEAFWPSS